MNTRTKYFAFKTIEAILLCSGLLLASYTGLYAMAAMLPDPEEKYAQEKSQGSLFVGIATGVVFATPFLDLASRSRKKADSLLQPRIDAEAKEIVRKAIEKC